MSKYNELVTKLREIFQIDRPELDFGIYRILNARAGEINQYLEKRLPEKVKQALRAGSAAQQAQVAQELKDKEAQYQVDGVDPATVPKVQELRQKLAQYTTGANEHENAVFSHLLAFFSRYFDNGDFISQRRYKGDTYAIPYAGEEVMLHWANKDQYYTKSGENFANYSFKLEDGRTVHFRLVAADTAKDNRKDNDKERRFALIERKTVTRIDEQGEEFAEELLPVEEVDGPASVASAAPVAKALVIRFEYKAAPKNTKQDALAAQAVNAVLTDAAVKARWLSLGQRAPTEKNPQRTLLEKHLSDYTTKNTADYFIHKDLGGFLKRELDFYIKNEVMHLDDVQNASAFADIEKSLRIIQCLRSIALELIDFLAQLENFQKKLWLKKKFVISSHLLVTLDRVPGALYSVIAENETQWSEWRRIGLWNNEESGTISDLQAMPFLMVNTSLFNVQFKNDVFQGVSNLDESIDGVIVRGDNYQGMRLLDTKYQGAIKCIYTDPPYNTKSRDFLYKDSYKHSSWASMMYDRLLAGKRLLAKDGIVSHYIDENEHTIASTLLTSIFGEENRCADIVWKNTSRNDQSYITAQHEYLITTLLDKGENKGEWREKKEGLDEIYTAFDGFKKKHGNDWKAIHKSALEFYNAFPESSPIFDSKHYSWMDERGVYFPSDISGPNFGQYVYDIDHPVTKKPCKRPGRGWSLPKDALLLKINDGLVHFGVDETTIPNLKTYLTATEFSSLTSVKYKDGRVASKSLNSMFGRKTFSNPKDVDLSSRFLKAFETDGRIVLDPFAGTGTTVHSIIDLERKNKTNRKYIAIEQGEYFDTIFIPRIQKAVYSADWKDGIPIGKVGLSHCVQVLNIESYEDTLNNLQLRRASGTADLFSTLPQQAQDDYLLRYMLDIESRGSLLSVEDFRKPFDYTLNVAVDSAGAFEPRQIDLVETFNYLIGLRVKHIDAQPERGFVTVTGSLPSGESCLVLWRDCEKLDYEGLNKLCDKLAINPADNEYEVVYLNGDHNIPTVLTQTIEEGGATRVLKLRQIEAEFLERMFSVEDI
jgi:adenine-specific DNA-methyltransferase